MTLSQALLPQTLLSRALMVVGGTAVLALASNAGSVPLIPVPMTLQTLAVLVIGFTYGARLGSLTVLAWLAEGAAGLPVFANGNGGLAYMTGPTGGFLVGFVLMAFVAGLAADRGVGRVVPLALVGLLASALLYVPGVAWPLLVAGKALPELWAGWVAPFLPGDAIKAVLAALAVSGGWAWASRRRA